MHRQLASLRVLASVSWMIVLPAGCKDDAAAKGDVIARATIGPDGGMLAGGGIELVIPAGALTADTDIELLTSSRDLTARDYVQQGGAMELTPEGLGLRLPAELKFTGASDDSVAMFVQDGLTVAGAGSSVWVNELGVIALASEGMRMTEMFEPMLGSSPTQPGMTFRDVAHFRVGLTNTPRFNVALSIYDFGQAYDKALNGTGEGDCGFELGGVQGGSLSAGCSDGPLTAKVGVTSAEIEFDVTPFQSGKLETPVVVGVIGGSDELAYQLGFLSFDTSPCYAETCSDYGTCEVQGDAAVCNCMEGFAPGEDLSCVCVPDCAGRQCGGDGCGGTCAPGCGDNEFCDDGSGQCMPDGSDTGTTDPTTDPTDASTTDPGSTSDPSGGSSGGGSSGGMGTSTGM